MNTSKLSEWVQIVASLGVIGGLLLVAFELNQNTLQLYGDSIRGIHESYRIRATTEIETDLLELFVKSFENPEELTTDEILKLSAYLSLIIDEYTEWENMYELGIVRYSGAENLIPEIDLYFTGPYGRAWYEVNKNWIKPSLADALDRELESRPVRIEPPDAKEIRSRLQESN